MVYETYQSSTNMFGVESHENDKNSFIKMNSRKWTAIIYLCRICRSAAKKIHIVDYNVEVPRAGCAH